MAYRNDIEELDSSELGTKEYWENSYEMEIENYQTHGDVGEIWFDEDSQLRIINWILQADIDREQSIIDLGCGNGMMLIELAREGFTNLIGVDYSPKAIELSQAIANDQDLHIQYKVADLLSDTEMELLGLYKIVHDKGTYDAISLNPDNTRLRRIQYIDNIYKILDDDGLFIITSCNWTEQELINTFNDKFSLHTVIPTPTFKFGGRVGNVVTSLVFAKNSN